MATVVLDAAAALQQQHTQQLQQQLQMPAPQPQQGLWMGSEAGWSQWQKPAPPESHMGGVSSPDPAMVNLYMQMFTEYFQQMQSYSTGALQVPFIEGSAPAVPPPLQMPGAQAVCQSTTNICVSVQGMHFQYQLMEDDLHKVFGRYGVVESIHIGENGTSAQIAFQNSQNAHHAMTDLNGKVLSGLDGTLRLSWAQHAPQQTVAPAAAAAAATSQSNAQLLAAYAAMQQPPTTMGGSWSQGVTSPPPVIPSQGMAACGGVVGASSLRDGCIESGAAAGTHDDSMMMIGEDAMEWKADPIPHVKGVLKHTCRYMIGIPNDKEFQVVRQIIGAKGAHMKRIVKQSDAKLRLRGVGSGYLEGASHKESSEPLQLCVSCTSADGYQTATHLVEELLERVYTDYRNFCRERGWPELDLHPTAQNTPISRRLNSMRSASGTADGGTGGTNEASDSSLIADTSLLSPGKESGEAGEESGEGANENGGTGERREGRRRGRRSRGKKSAIVDQSNPPAKAPPLEEINRLIDARNAARRQCNFPEADRIRQSLYERGVALMDEPGRRGKGAEVTSWRYWRE
jgi:hypothetical protein